MDVILVWFNQYPEIRFSVWAEIRVRVVQMALDQLLSIPIRNQAIDIEIRLQKELDLAEECYLANQDRKASAQMRSIKFTEIWRRIIEDGKSK